MHSIRNARRSPWDEIRTERAPYPYQRRWLLVREPDERHPEGFRLWLYDPHPASDGEGGWDMEWEGMRPALPDGHQGPLERMLDDEDSDWYTDEIRDFLHTIDWSD